MNICKWFRAMCTPGGHAVKNVLEKALSYEILIIGSTLSVPLMIVYEKNRKELNLLLPKKTKTKYFTQSTI